MKGLLSLVLVSIALLQTTAAVPTASARRGIVITRTPEIEAKDLEERRYIPSRYAVGTSSDEDEDLEGRSYIRDKNTDDYDYSCYQE